MLTELLMADHPTPCAKETADAATASWRRWRGGSRSASRRFPRREPRGQDDSSLVIAVDHNACILCDRCIRGCNDIRDNQVIGRMGKGYDARIAFDLDEPMGSSSCVSCGECMVSCPTGALTHRAVVEADPWARRRPPPEPVDGPGADRTPARRDPPRLRGRVAPVPANGTRGRSSGGSYKKGEIICREGEFGSTAFLIEKGSVDV